MAGPLWGPVGGPLGPLPVEGPLGARWGPVARRARWARRARQGFGPSGGASHPFGKLLFFDFPKGSESFGTSLGDSDPRSTGPFHTDLLSR